MFFYTSISWRKFLQIKIELFIIEGLVSQYIKTVNTAIWWYTPNKDAFRISYKLIF